MRGNEYFELCAFVAVLEQGSFHRAAQQLRLSPSALSQVIRMLEKRVNARLLNRTTRSLSATDAGARLLARIKPAFVEIDTAMANAGSMGGSPKGTLRLHAPRLAARVFLEPMFGRFQQTYPDIVLDITVDDAPVNIVERGFDLGMRLTEELDNDVVAIPVGLPMRYVAVATPGYVAACGAPDKPTDLLMHRCINWRPHGSGGASRWEFRKGRRSHSVAVEGPLVVSERNLALSASLQGVGIALVAEQLAAPFITAGSLVILLDEWSPPRSRWNIYYHKQRHTPATVRSFVDFAKSVEKSTE
ncbi:LysR family transcriptional regulator [Variovorax sp. KK3]|uniref:LysR family transcriptional regulator n=1 Tax=Variovorax sp. KK3 TaxID=1855728 RepID=UPI00097BD3A7|nr:LysR family transcriptional regulator [Variovorax sp. KK3]